MGLWGPGGRCRGSPLLSWRHSLQTWRRGWPFEVQSTWNLSTCGHCTPQILYFSLIEHFAVFPPGHILSPQIFILAVTSIWKSPSFFFHLGNFLILFMVSANRHHILIQVLSQVGQRPIRALVAHYVSIYYLSLFPLDSDFHGDRKWDSLVNFVVLNI